MGYFRQVANGEILGMSLMLEDVLQTGEHAFSLSDDPKAPKSPLVTDVDGSLLEESTPHLHLKNCELCHQFILVVDNLDTVNARNGLLDFVLNSYKGSML